jgi:hypothetical protein
MWLASALLCMIAAVAGHAILCRAPLPPNNVLRFLIVGGLAGGGLVWWLVQSYGVAAPQMWAGLLSYGLLCELYIFLFTLAMSSISANLLANLLRRKMTDDDIGRLYDSRRMVASRLDRLVAVGLLNETSEGLRLTPKGARMVRIFHRLKGFFRHPSPVSGLPGR